MNITKIIQHYKPAQDYYELEKVIEKVKPLNPKIIVEIGLYQCRLLKICEEIFCPDLQIGIDDTKEAIEYAKKLNAKAIILAPVKSQDEKTIQKVLKILNGDKIDFLIIDGDHRYDYVKKDFEIYQQFINKRSFIMFHDIAVSNDDPSFCEVQRYWESIKRDYNHFEVVKSVGTGLIINE